MFPIQLNMQMPLQGWCLSSLCLFVPSTVPPVIDQVSGSTAIDQGGSLELACHVAGVPEPGVTWVKDGATLQATPDSRVSFPSRRSLRILFVTKDDAGSYSCRAQSQAGSDAEFVDVRVRGTCTTELSRTSEKEHDTLGSGLVLQLTKNEAVMKLIGGDCFICRSSARSHPHHCGRRIHDLRQPHVASTGSQRRLKLPHPVQTEVTERNTNHCLS